MNHTEWIRKRFEATVGQGLGHWIEQSDASDLGRGIFAWRGWPVVKVFEGGFTYEGYQHLKFNYEKIIGLELLDLRSLMMANKAPEQLVDFAICTVEGRHVLHVPLFLYTTLSGVLSGIVEGLSRR